MQSLRRVLAVLVVAAGLVLAVPAGLARAQASEQILDYTVDLEIEAAGTLLVTEQIAYDFGTEERHGIFRDVPVRFRYDDFHDRVYPLEVLEVSGSPGTPVQYALEEVENKLRIRIGDPDQTISGQHDYRIVYRVEGTLNGFVDHDELYWNAIGADWEVPIEQASVTVTAPAAIGQVACYAGPVGSTRSCGASETDGPTASFGPTGLDPNEDLTVVVGFPTGVVPVPQPVLEERWSFTRTLPRAFAVTPGTLGMAGGVLVAVLLVLGWLFGITGRIRRRGAALGSVAGGMVESVPPEGIRPAQAGLLVDEVVTPVAISATLVDLAVRGYLRIEEDPAREDWEEPNWRLVKRKPADKDLLEYERRLLDGLFATSRRHADDAEAVWLSELPEDFYHQFNSVRSSLYLDAMKRGWFTEQPEKVRERWFTRGVGVTVLGAALTLVAALTSYGLVAIPILLAGPVLMVGAQRMPRHTLVGAELLRRVNGFRAYLAAARAEGPALPRIRTSSPPICPTPSCSASPTSGPAPLRWLAPRPGRRGMPAVSLMHRTGSTSACTTSPHPRPQLSPQSRQRLRAPAASATALAPQAAAVAGAAPRAVVAVVGAAAPGEPTSRARPMHCRRRAEHRRPSRQASPAWPPAAGPAIRRAGPRPHDQAVAYGIAFSPMS